MQSSNINLSERARGIIVGMWQAGSSVQNIATSVGCSTRTVRLWIQKYREGGELGLIDGRKNNRTKLKTSPDQDNAIIEYISLNPSHSARKALEALELPVGEKTVRRRINAAKIRPPRTTKKTAPVKRRAKKRASVASQESATNKEEMFTTVWVDEEVLSSEKDCRLRTLHSENSQLDSRVLEFGTHSDLKNAVEKSGVTKTNGRKINLSEDERRRCRSSSPVSRSRTRSRSRCRSRSCSTSSTSSSLSSRTSSRSCSQCSCRSRSRLHSNSSSNSESKSPERSRSGSTSKSRDPLKCPSRSRSASREDENHGPCPKSSLHRSEPVA